MRIKAGVKLDGVHWALWYAAVLWELLLQRRGYPHGTIVGGTEGADLMGPARVGGEHAAGLALDFRTRDLASADVQDVAGELRAALGPQWEVIVESDHVHVDIVPGTMR